MEIKMKEIKTRLVRNFTIFLISPSLCHYITLRTNAELATAVLLAVQPIVLAENI